ncbi:MAG: hypothetical protein NZ700_10545 [Gemmataceae bacterium]|nr:hypothetical protein [Gemmataceae bacterium]MDW8266960.1 hypothetical protein [Gemmataceae bacterium]
MKRIAWSLIVGGCWLLADTPVYGQLQQNSPYYRPPTVSPYLNLTRTRSPAANYYLGVRSEFRLRSNSALIQQLEQDFAARVPTSVRDEMPDRLPTTGHPVAFMMLSPYYAPLSPTPFAAGAPFRPNPPPSRRGR